MKKRILSLLLCLCMVLLMAPAAMATGDNTPNIITTADQLVTELGGSGYASVSDGKVVLSKDVTLDKGIDIGGTITLDLNGYSISPAEDWTDDKFYDYLIVVRRGGNLTIEDNSDSSTEKKGAIQTKLEGTTASNPTVAVKLTRAEDEEGPNSSSPATLTVNGGTLQGYYYGISGNGTRHGTNVTINGGEIEGKHGTGIYHPQDGTLTINNGEITGENAAVELRSGTLNIAGGILKSTAKAYNEEPNGSGTTVSGAALAISQHTTKKQINVSITGGTFNGKYAFSEAGVQAGSGEVTGVSLSISGGTFTGDVKSDDCTDFITGGSFTELNETAEKFEDYIPDGMKQDTTGKVVIDNDTAVAKIGDVGYANLQDAIDAAGTNGVGTTIELLKEEVTVSASGKQDTQGALTINKNLTINGNGHKISGTGFTAAGDAGGASLINIGTNTVNVTLNNVKLDGGATDTSTAGAKHGLNINSTGGTVTLNNVEIMNCRWYAVMNNGANLIVDGLKTHDNKWGINIDKGGSINIGGNTTIGEDASIVFENSKQDVAPSKNNQITGGSYQHIEIKDTNKTTGLTISGGKFSTAAGAPGTNYIDVEDYLAPGLELKADGSVGKPYTPPANPSYSITTPAAENGKVTVSPTSAKAGAKVTITVTPDDGFELDELTVTRGSTAVTVTKNSDGTYSFTMPQGSVTVTATFVCDGGDKCPSAPFTDVNTNLWYHEEIDYVVENGLMNGDSPTTFAPQRELSRAELAQILYNKEGRPAVEGDMVFADVPAGEWFYPAILWANQEEVVGGDSPTTFVPNRAITREELAVMLYRYAGKPAASGSLKDFTDGDEVSTWAEDAMVWAVTEGIISGDTPTTLDPGDGATRAEAAAMLMRFCENVEQ